MKEHIPSPIPPHFDFNTVPILKNLASASRALGQLKGEVSKVPNPQILIDIIILQEAKDSNEIENIVTTNDELYIASAKPETADPNAKEALGYSYAIKRGYDIIRTKGFLSVNDIIDLQKIIVPDRPIRKLPGTTLTNPKTNELVYVPPQNYSDILDLLSNFEAYYNNPDLHDIDRLIKMPILHYQFETIHPFYDGNGRTGRLLNVLYLLQRKLLDYPILYLSRYIIKNKGDYYRLLQEVRTKNNWEEWTVWMLKGVEETSLQTIDVINKIKDLISEYKSKIKNNTQFYSHELINSLFKHPYTRIEIVQNDIGVHRQTASKYLNELVGLGLLEKIRIRNSNYYLNSRLMNILGI